MKNFTKLSVSAALSCMKKALSSPSHQEKQSQHVRLFHFHGWPEIGIPADGRGMIDIIAAVQRQQQQSGNHPIIVHCRWGTSLWQFCIMMFQIVYSLLYTDICPLKHLTQPLSSSHFAFITWPLIAAVKPAEISVLQMHFSFLKCLLQ